MTGKTTAELLEIQARCPPEASLWRHKSSGSVYRVQGSAIREADFVPPVLYRRAVVDQMPTWSRPLADFLDRFEEAP